MKQFGITKLLMLFVFILIAMLWISGFNGLYGQDSYAYLDYCKQINSFFLGGKLPPPFFWPVAYPLLGGLICLLIPSAVISLLVLSILSSVLMLYYCYKIALHLFPEKRAEILLLLFMFLAASPYVVRSSVTIMSDILAMACVCGAIYHCLCLVNRANFLHLFAFTFFVCIGVISRYVAGVLLFIPLVYSGISLFKQKKIHYIFFAAVLASVFLLPHFYFKSGEGLSSLRHQWLLNWSLQNFTRHSFSTVDGFQNYAVPNLFFVFSNFIHPGFIFIGTLCLLLNKTHFFKKTESKLILFSLLLYALFLAGIPIQNQRFLLLSFPLIFILYLPVLFLLLSNPFILRNLSLLSILILLTQSAMCYRALRPFIQLNRMEKKIASRVSNYKNYQIIYSSGMEGPFNAYGIPQTQKSLYLNRYTIFETPALVLINPEEIEKQWQDKNPGINWNTLKKNYSLKELNNFTGGWKLYEIR